MATMKSIIIKPHHFLDIIKLYGSGFENFIPDLEYGHDFWKVGNVILEKPTLKLRLTICNDAICIPCKFNDGKTCSDVTAVGFKKISKDEYNKIIDRRLLELLGLENNAELSALEFCKLVKERIHPEDIFAVWKEKPVRITKKRASFLIYGVKKYLEKCRK